MGPQKRANKLTLTEEKNPESWPGRKTTASHGLGARQLRRAGVMGLPGKWSLHLSSSPWRGSKNLDLFNAKLSPPTVPKKTPSE